MEHMVATLRVIPLFAELPREVLAHLVGQMDEIEIEAGEIIGAPGAPGDAMFVIVAGLVEVRREHDAQWARVRSLGSGDWFGEVPLLTGEARTVTAVALAHAQLLRLDKERFFALLERYPAFVRGLARGLGQMVARSTESAAVAPPAPDEGLEAVLQECSKEEYCVLSRAAIAERPQTAVLAALPGCADAEQHLVALARRYPRLLPRAEDGQWRLHPDLRDLLRRRVGQDLGPAATAEIHDQLARAYGKRRERREALSHWLVAGRWGEAAHLLQQMKAGPEPVSDEELAEWRQRFPGDQAIVTELAAERARLLLQGGQAARAIALYRWALDARPSPSPAREVLVGGLAHAYFRTGQVREALATLKESQGSTTTAGALQHAVAARYLATGRDREAYEWARRARATSAGAPEPAASPLRRVFALQGWGGTALAVSAGLLVLLWQPPGGPSGPAVPFLAVLAAGAVFWARGRPPEFVVALGMGVAWAVTNVAPAPAIFAGFASSTWFLIVGVLGLAAALGRSGLLYRITLTAMQYFPPTFGGQVFAVALSGVLATVFIPSIAGRLVVMGPIVLSLSDAFRYPPRSRGSAALGLATLVGYCLSASLFLTGTASCLVAWRLLPAPARADVTWLSWLLWALPLELLTFTAALLWIIWRYRPEHVRRVSRRVLRAQLDTLGPVSREELVAGAVAMALVVAWLTQPWHGVDPASVAVAGLCVLVATGVLDRAAIQGRIDWPLLLLLGMIFSLGDLAAQLGVDAWLSGPARRALTDVHHPALAIAALVAVTMAVRFVLPWPTAVALLMLALAPAAGSLGLHPWIAALVTLKAGNIFLFPLQSPDYLTLYYSTEERAFSHAQVRPFAWAYAVIVLVAFLATVPYWWALGLVRMPLGAGG
jgi:anion transporter